jgi:hypothetical protein
MCKRMTKENDVKVEDTTTTPSVENNGQPENDSEVVNTPQGDGKDYKTIAENLSKALREEREKNKKKQEPVEPVEVPQTQDDTVKRFLRTEADAYIAKKIAIDPSFKDRLDIVENYVSQGYTIDMADKLAKAEIMDKILAVNNQEEVINKPKQITPTATPETEAPKTTGNVLDDVLAGNREVEDPAIIEMLKKYRKA